MKEKKRRGRNRLVRLSDGDTDIIKHLSAQEDDYLPKEYYLNWKWPRLENKFFHGIGC